MSSATLDMLTARYGERLLLQLTDRATPPAGAVDSAIVDAALGDTDAVIDGCVAMVEENMKTQPNQQLIESIRQRFSHVEQMLVDAKSLCYTPPFDSWPQNMLNILKLR